MLHIEREILQLADEAGVNGPQLPVPDCIRDAVDRLLRRRHLSADGGRGIEITEQGRAALADN